MRHDTAMAESNFDRNFGDQYYTEPWVTKALLEIAGEDIARLDSPVWEPAAGRGDIEKVLNDYGLPTVVSDKYPVQYKGDSEFITEIDFLEDDTNCPLFEQCEIIITNPPYGKQATQFLMRALQLRHVNMVCMLLRSEFNSAGSRSGLFNGASPYPVIPFAYEIVLTSRPRWDDWWKGDKPKASPRHNYSWFVWDRGWKSDSTQYWVGKDDVK